MTLRRVLHRRTWSTILAAGSVAIVLPIIASAASQDIGCLKVAAHDRANAMHGIYDDYAFEAKRLGDKLGDDEDRSLNQTDLGFRQSELDRINSDYTYGMSAAWANVVARSKQVWSDYQQRRVGCGFGTTTNGPSYPTSQPPPFGNTQYLPAAPVQPPWWPGNNQPVCPQQILQTPPSDCSYSCQRDWNGCKICNLRCRSIMQQPGACACPMMYAPVCATDGRTYDNSCLASCAGVSTWYGGVCR